MSFAHLLPRAPWTPPPSQPAQRSQPAQPAARNNQPAGPYSKSRPSAQPALPQQVAPLPEQGQGTMALVQRRNSASVYSLEIMSARRSRQQLAQWVSADCFHRLLPFFPKNPRQVRKDMLLTLPPVLLRVRAQKVHEELYEVVALLRCAERVRVVTMQMRLIHGMWLITAIEQPQSRADED